MPNVSSPDTDTLVGLINRDLTNNEIADAFLLSRTLFAPRIDAVRAELRTAAVQAPPLGPWGHRRG